MLIFIGMPDEDLGQFKHFIQIVYITQNLVFHKNLLCTRMVDDDHQPSSGEGSVHNVFTDLVSMI